MKDEMVVKFLREAVLGIAQNLFHLAGGDEYVRDIVVHGGEGAIWAADRSSGTPPTVKLRFRSSTRCECVREHTIPQRLEDW